MVSEGIASAAKKAQRSLGKRKKWFDEKRGIAKLERGGEPIPGPGNNSKEIPGTKDCPGTKKKKKNKPGDPLK